MDLWPGTRMFYFVVATAVFLIHDIQTTAQEKVPRTENINQTPEPDFNEQTGSSIPSDGQTQDRKRELEQREKRKDATLVDTWTMYKPNGKTFEQNIKQMCLSAHLWLRKKHLKDVTVKYKKSLARDAEKWALYLANTGRFEHEDGIYRDFGENIYKLDNTYDFVPNPVNAIASWYAESYQPGPKGAPPKDYDYTFNPSNTVKLDLAGVGHFTQLIWDTSIFIGCGAATTTFKRGVVTYTSTIIVTRYLVPGNQVNQFPQHVFPLRNGAATLKDLNISKLFPGKKDCVDSLAPVVCDRWNKLQWCDRSWAISYCNCTCTQNVVNSV